MVNESKLYPVLYNPEIQFLVDFGKLDFGLDVTLPTLDDIQESTGSQSQQQAELIKSGIMVGLKRAIDKSEDDYDSVLYAKFTGDIVTDNIIRDDIKDYYENRLYAQATQICDYIDGLIKLDKYPKKMFGDYKLIRQFINSNHIEKENSRALDQLRIIAKQMIPIDVMYPVEEVVEGSILSSSQVSEG